MRREFHLKTENGLVFSSVFTEHGLMWTSEANSPVTNADVMVMMLKDRYSMYDLTALDEILSGISEDELQWELLNRLESDSKESYMMVNNSTGYTAVLPGRGFISDVIIRKKERIYVEEV